MASDSTPSNAALAAAIDHTLLDPFADEGRILALCHEATSWGCAAVCVHPTWIGAAARAPVRPRICTVIGFPHGANTTAAKVYETRDAIAEGADEIDMVINLAAIMRRDVDAMTHEIRAIVDAADGRIVKVILESGNLTRDQIVAGCEAAEIAGAHFVKTSTGFLGAGACLDHVRIMRAAAASLKVKASGGIRDRPTALAMLDAGADRLGLSKTALVLGREDP
ncbi:MAG: deoxyribose-phosphate aldolase [Nannocystaceae bacterium]